MNSLRVDKAVIQQFTPTENLLVEMEIFSAMTNDCVRIGLESGATSLKTLSLKAYHNLDCYASKVKRWCRNGLRLIRIVDCSKLLRRVNYDPTGKQNLKNKTQVLIKGIKYRYAIRILRRGRYQAFSS